MFVLDLLIVDDVWLFLGWIVILNGVFDIELQQQLMNLMCELFRGCCVIDLKCFGLFLVYLFVVFEQVEEQIVDNVGCDVWFEELIWNCFFLCEFVVDIGLLIKVCYIVVFIGLMSDCE